MWSRFTSIIPNCLCIHSASWLQCNLLLNIKKSLTKQPLGEVSELAIRIKNIPTVILSMLYREAFKYSGKRNVACHILNYRKKKKTLIPEMRCDKKEPSSDLALIQVIRETPKNLT